MTYETKSTGGTPQPERTRLTVGQVLGAVESDACIGFCVRCGTEHFGVEPDAREYLCDACGERKVYGAEDLLVRLAY